MVIITSRHIRLCISDELNDHAALAKSDGHDQCISIPGFLQIEPLLQCSLSFVALRRGPRALPTFCERNPIQGLSSFLVKENISEKPRPWTWAMECGILHQAQKQKQRNCV